MTDKFNEELGRRIKKAREGKAKFTQAALGKQIGLSRTAVTNIEAGRQRLLVEQLVEIAQLLDVPPADLLPDRIALKPEIVEEAEGSPAVKRWIKKTKTAAQR